MSAPVTHWFGPYGPLCGTRDGVNAADMEPSEITCRRCLKVPVDACGWLTRTNQPVLVVRGQLVYRGGRAFLEGAA